MVQYGINTIHFFRFCSNLVSFPHLNRRDDAVVVLSFERTTSMGRDEQIFKSHFQMQWMMILCIKVVKTRYFQLLLTGLYKCDTGISKLLV